jgi:hypothetical protein
MSTFRRRRLLSGLLAVSVSAASIGCSDDPPSQPTTPTATVESVSLSGGRDLVEGETVTLSVSIRWSNGSTGTVSDGVTWTTEDSSVATVTNRGDVTALAPGEARIRATFNNVAGATTLKVTPGTRVTTGRVHESRPTEHIGVPGARVTVVSSDGTTETAVTDGAGDFSVRLKLGSVRVTVTASGYDVLATEVLATPGASLSLAVVPTAGEVRISFPYIHTGSPNNPPRIQQRTFRIDVHHSGELRAAYTDTYQLASSQGFTCLEVRDSTKPRPGRLTGALRQLGWIGPGQCSGRRVLRSQVLLVPRFRHRADQFDACRLVGRSEASEVTFGVSHAVEREPTAFSTSARQVRLTFSTVPSLSVRR